VRPVGTPFEEQGVTLLMSRTGAEYFETMGVQIVEGRPLIEADDEEGAHSLVISEAAVARLWPGQTGVGKTVRWRENEWTVVGVAENAKYLSIGENAVSRAYVPQARIDDGNLTFVVRTAGSAEELALVVESVVHEIDPVVAVFGVQTLQDLVDEQAGPYRAMATLAIVFGGIALLLAAVGLYGVQTYLVGQRSKEIGIRIAVGATARQVGSAILRRGLALGGVGVALGMAVALGLGRLIEGMLFGVAARDPVSLGGVAAILLTVSLAASFPSARRASRVDPMTILRVE
jgi:ABC-type antimicrobial peptide transport system permease subunit